MKKITNTSSTSSRSNFLKRISAIALVAATFLLASSLWAFNPISDPVPKSKRAPNSCKAKSLLGGSCSIECGANQTPSCTSDLFSVDCHCEPISQPQPPHGDLALDPNHKYDILIATALGWGSINGTAFANALSGNKLAVIQNNWTDFNNTVAVLNNIYNNLLTPSEKAAVNDILYPAAD